MDILLIMVLTLHRFLIMFIIQRIAYMIMGRSVFGAYKPIQKNAYMHDFKC